MSDKAKTNEHDEKTNQAAESLRALVVRHKVRGGMTQRDTDALLSDLEQFAVGLEEQGKSKEEIAKMQEERDEPNLSDPEVIAETVEKDREKAEKDREEAEKQAKAEGKPFPLEPAKTPSIDPNANRLGIPAVTAQPTTGQREAVEKAAKDADDKIRAASHNPLRKEK
jgi:hypothetical protein